MVPIATILEILDTFIISLVLVPKKKILYLKPLPDALGTMEVQAS
jgi:hypothetical protein